MSCLPGDDRTPPLCHPPYAPQKALRLLYTARFQTFLVTLKSLTSFTHRPVDNFDSSAIMHLDNALLIVLLRVHLQQPSYNADERTSANQFGQMLSIHSRCRERCQINHFLRCKEDGANSMCCRREVNRESPNKSHATHRALIPPMALRDKCESRKANDM